jgi:carbon monoxide dehydrogenase subunit G
VNVHGSHRFAAPREAVFDAIRDPGALLAVIPGCEAVTEVAADEYEGRITLRLPGAVGSYRTHVRLVEVARPDRCRLEGRVEGSMGTITGGAQFALADAAPGTSMTYEGSGVIGGPLARLDSGFAERLAQSLIGQGLAALDRRLATEGHE